MTENAGFEGWVHGHPPCDGPTDRAAMVQLIDAYDTSQLENESRVYFQTLADKVNALEADPHPDAIQAIWRPLVTAINEMPDRLMQAMDDRLGDYGKAHPEQSAASERAMSRFMSIYEHRLEKQLWQMQNDGLDLATGQPRTDQWMDIVPLEADPEFDRRHEVRSRHDAAVAEFSKDWWAKENATANG